MLTDFLPLGIGPDVQHRSGTTNANFLNVENSCTSWISALNVARGLVQSSIYKRVVIVTVTSFASRMPALFQPNYKGAWVLGDGASATLMVADEEKSAGSILAIREQPFGEFYAKMRLEPPPEASGRTPRYWEPTAEPPTIQFSEGLADMITEHLPRRVPEAVRAVLQECNLTTGDVDMLLTHQPNRALIDAWRELLGIKPPRAHDTFEKYGNLFMTSLPASLADALERGMIERGDLIAAVTFANAGEHLSAMAMRW